MPTRHLRDPLEACLKELNDWRKGAKAVPKLNPPPPTLFHYTSTEGLLGILEGGTIRHSDPLFLNDGSEVYYSNALLRDTLGEFMATKPRSERNLAATVRDIVARTAFIHRPVIFCMSAAPDLLNQWRDYGKDIVPYCIEFNTTGLLSGDWNFPCDLVQMIYDPTAQREILLTLFDRAYRALYRYPTLISTRTARQTIVREILSLVWGVLIQFKNPAFAVEAEWRLLGYSANLGGQRVEFRPSRVGAVPYIARVPRQGTLLPVASVCVGPSPHSVVSQMALERLLNLRGYNCPAYYSTIPVR